MEFSDDPEETIRSAMAVLKKQGWIQSRSSGWW